MLLTSSSGSLEGKRRFKLGVQLVLLVVMVSLTERRTTEAGAWVAERGFHGVPTGQKAAVSAVLGVLHGLPPSDSWSPVEPRRATCTTFSPDCFPQTTSRRTRLLFGMIPPCLCLPSAPAFSVHASLALLPGKLCPLYRLMPFHLPFSPGHSKLSFVCPDSSGLAPAIIIFLPTPRPC